MILKKKTKSQQINKEALEEHPGLFLYQSKDQGETELIQKRTTGEPIESPLGEKTQ
jgi:hypothetical protein